MTPAKSKKKAATTKSTTKSQKKVRPTTQAVTHSKRPSRAATVTDADDEEVTLRGGTLPPDGDIIMEEVEGGSLDAPIELDGDKSEDEPEDEIEDEEAELSSLALSAEKN